LTKLIVADAGPLIGLGRREQLDLLFKVVEQVFIPSAVQEECTWDTSKPGAKAIQIAIAKGKMKIKPIEKAFEFNLLDTLGRGEIMAIHLAITLQCPLLIDERLGRKAAVKMGVKVVGTAGVLLMAKKKGFIKSVRPLLDELIAYGYRLSPELIKEILLLANE
jgi:predicted nucleic acid-binding protein